MPPPPRQGLRTHARKPHGPAQTPRELEQLRADAERERDEILARLTDKRLSEVTTAHAAELGQVRADAAREREELRGALESRASGRKDY